MKITDNRKRELKNVSFFYKRRENSTNIRNKLRDITEEQQKLQGK